MLAIIPEKPLHIQDNTRNAIGVFCFSFLDVARKNSLMASSLAFSMARLFIMSLSAIV
ncbi:hypothetical protein [Dickeya fangzhongdai]|uniref:hypothetical protein n=1 Tax=Dickeya fangzhongdai TaxID=1778540 RepID=UPI0023E3AB36|nr:hypothetical protein [Dickeya fangzhongdai]WES89482.1 hypothetical protein PQ617_02820 [Dickeya fangzhongdai]WOY05564.1 hypothetical protein OGM21_05650 [Dickeya fangzhongdai]